LDSVKDLENELEKGKRCEICFDKRLEESANKTLELGEKSFTTTLLVSPLKSQEQLKKSGKFFYEKYGIKFIVVDYRSKGGTQEQNIVTKEQKLYRQDYCGCFFALKIQRKQQNKIMDEMFSSISNQVLPASIEERLALYQKRIILEDKNIQYKIIKQKFLNYRQFNLKVNINKTTVIDAYALTYSTLQRKRTQVRIDFLYNDVYYMNREEIQIISLYTFNKLSNKNYHSVKELIFNSPTFEDEILVRNKIKQNAYSLTPIIILDEIIEKKLTIFLDAKTYEDTRETIMLI